MKFIQDLIDQAKRDREWEEQATVHPTLVAPYSVIAPVVVPVAPVMLFEGASIGDHVGVWAIADVQGMEGAQPRQ